MSKVIENNSFPTAMREKLDSIRLRAAVMAGVKAVAIASSVLLVCQIAAMTIDWWFTIFSTGVRTTLTLTSLSLTAFALTYFAVKPIREALGWTTAAKNVDKEIPQLEERWTTVANFANSDVQPQSSAQKAMLKQVTSEAVALGQLVKPAEVIRPVSLRRPAITLLTALVAFGGFMAMQWEQTTVLWQRFWMPTASITATQLECVTGDAIVPRGQSIEIFTNMIGLQRTAATFIMEGETFPIEEAELKADPDHPNVVTCIVDVDESFRYRLLAGDSQTQWHQVTAIDFPKLADVKLTVTPPNYVADDPVEKSLIPGRIRAIQGSTLNLHVRPDSDLEHFELRLVRTVKEANDPQTSVGDDTDFRTLQETLPLKPDADGWYLFTTPLMEDFSFSTYLRNTHGLENESPRVCRIHVIADKAPVARVISPTEEMAVSPDDEIEVKFEAHDDHGIATAELIVYDDSKTEDGEEPKVLAVKQIPLGDQELRKHVMGSTKLNLKDLNLEDGANISYAVRVTDNRDIEIDANEHRIADREHVADNDGNVADSGPTESGTNSTTKTASKTDDSDTKKETRVASKDESESGLQSSDRESADDLENKIANRGDDRAISNRDQTREPKPPADSTGPSTDNPIEKQTDEMTISAIAENDRNAQSVSDGTDKEAESPKNAKDDGPANSVDVAPKDDNSSNSNDEKPNDQLIAKRDNSSNNANNIGSNGATSDSNSGEERRRHQRDKNPFPNLVKMSGQSSDGQRRETNRQRLRITEHLMAVARSSEKARFDNSMNERFASIDRLLAQSEQDLTQLVDKAVPDAKRPDKYKQLDKRLGDTEDAISSLRDETRDTKYAFSGLQMVDIGRTHVTPSRDAVFVAIRDLDVAADVYAKEAQHHVMSARELLAELLKKIERVKQDRKLAKDLNEAVKIYEVYVEKAHQLVREARQNKNPLKRKMQVNEYEQAYLDRYAEVEQLRRAMMAEFARILAEDPRLMARYLELRKRRRSSLRDQLSELAERQDEVNQEVAGWQQVDEAQRDGLWMVVSEIRLQAAAALSKNSQGLATSIEKQMPLILEASRGSAALVIQHSKNVALLARKSQLDAKKAIQSGADPDANVVLRPNAYRLVNEINELVAALDQLNFESESKDGVTEFVDARQLQTRALADQADSWLSAATSIENREFHQLAFVDQQQIAIETELLRVGLLNIEDDLETQFQQAQPGADELVDVPPKVRSLARELQHTMETITFNQSAAEFALTSNRIDQAANQEAKAMAGFEKAEALLDRIRRKTAAALDEIPGRDPDIAQLRDPTLDRFLANLEREPNIEAQLGIPNRPRNLRILAQAMISDSVNGNGLGDTAAAAIARAKKEMKKKLKMQSQPKERELTEEEKQQLAAAEDMKEMLKQKLRQQIEEAKEQSQKPETPDEEKERLKRAAENLKKMMQQMEDGDLEDNAWDKFAKSEQNAAMLKAIRRGDPIPDTQWNKLMSSLEDGLWQVRGRVPPEDYRKAIEQYQDSIRRLTEGTNSE